MVRVWRRLLSNRFPFIAAEPYGPLASVPRQYTTMTRSYADAIASLNTLQSNFAIVDAIRKSGKKMNEQAIPEMIEWCQRIGYEPSEFKKLNAIHIAGTKGKGSTAAFTSSILTQYLGRSSEKHQGKPLAKVGLYTSPHLRLVRERIQINGEPLSEEYFTRYFFETWDRLEAAAEREGSDPKSPTAKPVYFRFLTLMAFHTYMSEGVDTAILECGIGGAYDSTNVLQDPSVTGITNLGIDHVAVLGGTLPEIAWHKAGIMKTGVKCFTTTSQKPEAKEVLEKAANEKNCELVYVDVAPKIQSGEVRLGLEADFQKINASVAIALADEWLTRHGYTPDQALTDQGLQKTRWAGRCETRKEHGVTWCIDGGHTLDSIEAAGRWFASVLNAEHKTSKSRFLIFNQQTRDAGALARALHNTLAAGLNEDRPFTSAIFCTNTTYRDTGFKPDLVSINTNSADVEELTVQKQLARTWAQIDPSTTVEVVKTIEEAVELVRGRAKAGDEEVTALVTGSLHLVGGFLEVLEGTKSDV